MVIMGAIVIIGVLLFFWLKNRPGPYDSLTQCLTQHGVKMYGAFWCPHCAAQKKVFGSSWQYVNYVECSLPNGQGQNDLCTAAGIEGYPTWEFAGGNRVPSELSVEQLTQLSNCTVA